MRRLLTILAVTCAAPALLACGGAGAGNGAVVRVFAAASLTDAFTDVAETFEQYRPGASVELHLAGSSSLREQVLQGAPADVFASANRSTMEQLEAAGVVTDPRTFATNHLRIAVPAGNPGGVEDLADLAREELLVGLCAEAVPCGELARQALRRAGVTPSLDTAEPDVRALLTKVAAGELDAGVVYATDVRAAGSDVEGIEIAPEHAVVARYRIATVAGSGDGAEAFIDFVLGTEGQAILRRHGFGLP